MSDKFDDYPTSIDNALDCCEEYDPISSPQIIFPALDDINKNCKLQGKNICFTGFMPEEKDHIREICKDLNISIKTCISSKLELLVCGNNPGPSKMRQCKEQGIKIISADDFINEVKNEI